MLENLVSTSTVIIDKAVSLYKKLIEEKHAKVYDLYGSLLQNILLDDNRGRALVAKRNFMTRVSDQIKNSNKLTRFDDDREYHHISQ